MQLQRFGIAAALALAVLTASAASAGEQFKITPPPGWDKKPSDNAMVLAYWIEPNPTGFRQNLNLATEPFGGTLANYVAVNKATMKKSMSDITFGPEGDFQTCGNHSAHFLSWKSASFGRKLVFEQALSVWFGRGYVLTYSREQGQPEITDAQSALATLCIRQE